MTIKEVDYRYQLCNARNKSTKMLRLLDNMFSPISNTDPNHNIGFAIICRTFCPNKEINISHLRVRFSSLPTGNSTHFLCPKSRLHKMEKGSHQLISSGLRIM